MHHKTKYRQCKYGVKYYSNYFCKYFFVINAHLCFGLSSLYSSYQLSDNEPHTAVITVTDNGHTKFRYQLSDISYTPTPKITISGI